MKKPLWFKITVGVAVVLIFIGMAPLAYSRWWWSVHTLEPLSTPISLAPGEYTSPVFTTDSDDGYQIEIYFVPQHRNPLDVDWKIVDETGAVLQSGHYEDPQFDRAAPIKVYGNDAILERDYRPPKRGMHQRAVLTIQHDVEATGGADTRLHVGQPSKEDFGYGVLAVLLWAAVVGGSGAIMLLVLLAMLVFRRASSAGPA